MNFGHLEELLAPTSRPECEPAQKSCAESAASLPGEPEYSEEARKAKVQGTVVLSIIVTASGQVGNIRVIRSLGLGLDERAINAVRQWKFRAATVEGKPAAAQAVVEVNFRLL